jgi:hypothetical protein
VVISARFSAFLRALLVVFPGVAQHAAAHHAESNSSRAGLITPEDVAVALERVAAIHGQHGPISIARYHMGEAALKTLGLPPGSFDLEVAHHSPAKVQWSCIAGGLRAGTCVSADKLIKGLRNLPSQYQADPVGITPSRQSVRTFQQVVARRAHHGERPYLHLVAADQICYSLFELDLGESRQVVLADGSRAEVVEPSGGRRLGRFPRCGSLRFRFAPFRPRLRISSGIGTVAVDHPFGVRRNPPRVDRLLRGRHTHPAMFGVLRTTISSTVFELLSCARLESKQCLMSLVRGLKLEPLDEPLAVVALAYFQ